jgi:MFS family permease
MDDKSTPATTNGALVADEKEQAPLQAQNDETNRSETPSLTEKPLDAAREGSSADVEGEKTLESSEHSDSEEPEYPSSWKLGLITTALCLSVFCMALDNTILAVAIPKITDQFQSLDDVGWYGSSYLLTLCSLQLFFGKLYTFYSIKWTYLIALAIFEIGSLICATAPTSTALIVGRAIAGIGAAGIFSGAILIIAHAVPLQKRPTYTGLIGGMYGIASVAGPLMGGAFTDNENLRWPWCFWINLPFGGVTAIFIVFFYKSPKSVKKLDLTWRGKLEQFDVLGMSLLVVGVICLLLALQWGGAQYEWSNWRIILLLVLFGLVIIGFLGVQVWKGDHATVPPRLMKNRNIWGGSLFGAMLGGAFFVMIFWIPIWFQAIKGTTAVRSGIDNLPMVLGTVICSIVTGAAVTFLGYYTPFIYGSTILMSVGAGLISTFEVDTETGKWIGYQIIFGSGVGFGMQQTLIAVQTVLPIVDVPVGTAIIMFAQMLGGALFLSVGQNVFNNTLIKNLLAARIPNFNPGIVVSAGATELQSKLSAADKVPVLIAYNDALATTFYVSVACAAFSAIGALAMEWKSVKGKKIEVAAA